MAHSASLSTSVNRRILIALALTFAVVTSVSFALAAINAPCSGEVVGHHIFTAPEHPEFHLLAGDTPEDAVVKFLALVESKGNADTDGLIVTKLDDSSYVVKAGRIQMGVSQIEGKFVVTSSQFCAEDNVPGLYADEP